MMEGLVDGHKCDKRLISLTGMSGRSGFTSDVKSFITPVNIG